MSRHVADVAVEDVDCRDRDDDGQGERELDDRDDRDQQDVGAQPIRVDEHEDRRERDEPEGEADDLAEGGRHGQDELGEVELLDQPLARHDRRRAVVDARREPLPGQNRGEDEQRVVRLRRPPDHGDEDDVDAHLEERVENPPDVAEELVGALLLELGLDEIAGETPPAPDLPDSLQDHRQRADLVRASIGDRRRCSGHARRTVPCRPAQIGRGRLPGLATPTTG